MHPLRCRLNQGQGQGIDKCNFFRLSLMMCRLIVSFFMMCSVIHYVTHMCRSVEVSSQRVEPVAAAATATPPPAARETVSTPPESPIVVVQGSIVQFKVFTEFCLTLLLTVIRQKQCM